MDVIGVVLVALGIVLYVEFNCSWKGTWKIVASIYSLCFGVVLIGAYHPWMYSWMIK